MDEQQKKTALRMIPYGIFLVGTCHEEELDVFIGSWITQTSFKPPLVVLAIRESNQARQIMLKSGVFSISAFGAQQKALASRFLREPVFEGQTINGVEYKTDLTGSPILVDAPAYIECKVVEVVERGDHHLFIGEVVNASAGEPQDVLTTVLTGWKYGG